MAIPSNFWTIKAFSFIKSGKRITKRRYIRLLEETREVNKQATMKFTTATTLFATAALLTSSANAFAPATRTTGSTPTSDTVLNSQEDSSGTPDIPTPEAPDLLMSEALPWMERPPALDGTLAGDVGFDPLGFAKGTEQLYSMREAEVKHARLAMLAAAGWPLSELFDKKLANVVGLDPVVNADNQVPSLLNGGLEKVSPLYWGSVLAAAAAIDLYGQARSKENDPTYTPGDLGFDPLSLYKNQNPDRQRWMELAEIKNGRLAMIGITGFAFQEGLWNNAVVDQTPIFFKPIGEAFAQATNTGYIQP
jgi:hypothetical protein